MPASNFRLRGFRRLADAVVDSLGKLELEAMTAVRRMRETNVRQVCTALGDSYAYTTIMTTLDRLYKKGLLERRKIGRAFYYSPKYSYEEMERGMAADVIESLFDNSAGRVGPVLACLVEAVSDRDRLLLDELERLVREKRCELEARK